MDIINYRKLFRVSIEVEQITEASVLAGRTRDVFYSLASSEAIVPL